MLDEILYAEIKHTKKEKMKRTNKNSCRDTIIPKYWDTKFLIFEKLLIFKLS